MRLMALVLVYLAANTAIAQDFANGKNKFYVGGGANYIDARAKDDNGNTAGLSFRTIELHGGYKYNGFLSVEARAGFGLTDESINVVGLGSVDTSLDYHASVFWRPETANKTTKIYGLLGFSSVSVSQDDNSESDSGISYGGGVGFSMYNDWNLNLEYRKILDNDDNDFSAFGATVDYRF